MRESVCKRVIILVGSREETRRAASFRWDFSRCTLCFLLGSCECVTSSKLKVFRFCLPQFELGFLSVATKESRNIFTAICVYIVKFISVNEASICFSHVKSKMLFIFFHFLSELCVNFCMFPPAPWHLSAKAFVYN